MIREPIINFITSSLVLFLLIFGFKKFKIRSMIIKTYENRNFNEEIKLQTIQDVYYANKRQIQELQEEIESIKLNIQKLEKWFQEEKESLYRKRDKLKRQKYHELYDQYKKMEITKYIRNSLMEQCNSNILNQEAIHYVESIENK